MVTSSREILTRKRLLRWEGRGDVRFITFSCYKQLPLFRNEAIRGLFVDRLLESRARTGFELFAWVVMPEHVHLLVRIAESARWARSASSLKNSVAKRVINRWRELDASILRRLQTEAGETRFWQRGGGFDRNVRNMSEFTKAVRYIHRNPVERELVTSPLDWAWSSARWWNGDPNAILQCDPPPGDPRSWTDWKGYM